MSNHFNTSHSYSRIHSTDILEKNLLGSKQYIMNITFVSQCQIDTNFSISLIFFIKLTLFFFIFMTWFFWCEKCISVSSKNVFKMIFFLKMFSNEIGGFAVLSNELNQLNTKRIIRIPSPLIIIISEIENTFTSIYNPLSKREEITIGFIIRICNFPDKFQSVFILQITWFHEMLANI